MRLKLQCHFWMLKRYILSYLLATWLLQKSDNAYDNKHVSMCGVCDIEKHLPESRKLLKRQYHL